MKILHVYDVCYTNIHTCDYGEFIQEKRLTQVACHCESLWIIMWCSLTRQTVHFILTRQTVHFNAEWPHLKNWFQEPSVRLPQRDCQIDRSTKIDWWCPPFCSGKRLASNWNEEVRKAKFKTSDSKLQIPNLYIDLNFRTRTDCLD